MRRGELVEIVKSMGLIVEERNEELRIKTEDDVSIACVNDFFEHEVALFGSNIPIDSNIDVDLLANTLLEYSKTPIGRRNFLTKEKRQKFIFKSILNLADEVNEINSSEGDMYKTITLNLSLDVIEEIREWINE